MHPLQTYSQGRHFLHNIGANSSTTDILALDKGMVGKDFPPLVTTTSFLTFKSFFSLLFYSSDLTRKQYIVPVGSLEFQILFAISLRLQCEPMQFLGCICFPVSQLRGSQKKLSMHIQSKKNQRKIHSLVPNGTSNVGRCRCDNIN